MDVLAAAKRLDEAVLTADVRQHTQLYLRIVRADQALPSVRVKRATDTLPPLGAHGDVLQVRI